MIDPGKIADLISKYVVGDSDIELEPYSFNDTKVLLGVPPVPLVGLDYLAVRAVTPKTKRFQSLSGDAVFVHNLCHAGQIEIGMLSGSLAAGHIALNELSGIPYPIVIQDARSGGSSQVVATGCQLIETPEWRRDAMPGTTVYTFETGLIVIAHGIHLPYVLA